MLIIGIQAQFKPQKFILSKQSLWERRIKTEKKKKKKEVIIIINKNFNFQMLIRSKTAKNTPTIN